jgi:hypothetical protein
MSFDAQAMEQPAKKPDIWKLPEIVSVKAAKVTYRKPIVRYKGLERREYSQAIEITVETSSGIPVRALSPALYVGDVEIADYEQLGKNLYLFVAVEVDELAAGQPVVLDWPLRRSKQKEKAMVLQLGREETK